MQRFLPGLKSMTAAVCGAFVMAGAASANVLERQTEYDGSFSEVNSSDTACDAIFATADYHTRHFLTGPSRRTSVLYFNGDAGFFDGVSLIGLLGGSNDLFYEKTIERDGLKFGVTAAGLIDFDVVYLEFAVEAKNASGDVVCEATANYTGFN